MRRAPLALLLAAGLAHANGRAPLTNGIHFQPNDPHSLYVATTFGLLVSHDDGCTMYWICESNMGYGGMFDPKYAISTSGAIFATTYTGLRVSRDGGCSWTTATSELPPDDPNNISTVWIDALDIGSTGEVWVATADISHPNNIYSSNDDGVTFNARNMQSPTIWWKSVKVAPSNPMRIYASGYQVAGSPLPDGGMAPPTGHLLHSDDDGATWTESPLTGVTFSPTAIVLVAAVDPSNPDVAYMISLAANTPAGDMLYRTSDAGATWTKVLTTTDTIRDVVISDAQTVLVATQMGGSFKSTDGGMTFGNMLNPPQLECLGKSPDGSLVGCGANWQPDYESVAKSSDIGSSWSKVWRFVNLYGPLDCPAGTGEHDMCAVQQWPSLQQQFGTTGPACGAFQSEGGGGDATTATKKSGGCCDAGTGTPIGLVWAGGLALWLGRRRRHASRQLG
ncbi:MAG TPA: MYXO-CTERM sorting domain-containing protein [Kofleriaceae bacterium]|nr:MYXO-CTERM sorting domain-containing protein [Kofleriaceae bacterium]